MKYRIITKGTRYRVQWRDPWWPFWDTKREYATGNPKDLDSMEEAEKCMQKVIGKHWVQTKSRGSGSWKTVKEVET